jgi:hypothetical protein
MGPRAARLALQNLQRPESIHEEAMTNSIVPVSGMAFKAQRWCERCHQAAPHLAEVPCFCGAQDALAELVELKRMKDSGSAPVEYERRKLAAWREAFRVCGVVEDPKS